MLPKKYRFDLRSNQVFLRSSTCIDTSSMKLYVKKTEQTQGAIVVSKKTFPLASDRSLIKRRLRAALLVCLKEKSGITVLIYGKKQVEAMEHQQLVEAIQTALAPRSN